MSANKSDESSFSHGKDDSHSGKTLYMAIGSGQRNGEKQQDWPVLSFSTKRNLLFCEKPKNTGFGGANDLDLRYYVAEGEDKDTVDYLTQEHAPLAQNQPTGHFKTLVFLRFLAVTVLVAAALVLVALLLKASLLPSAIAGVVVGLSALAYNAIFGSAIAAGALAVVSTLPLYLARKEVKAGGIIDVQDLAFEQQKSSDHVSDATKFSWRGGAK
jgi:hypothetical protein